MSRQWLEKQTRQLPDGDYLIRPYGRAVYRVTGGDKERFITYRYYCWLLALFAVLGTPFLHLSLTNVGLIFCPVLVADRVIGRWLLRRGTKVDSSLWSGPAVVDQFGYFPKWYWWGAFILCSVMALISLLPAAAALISHKKVPITVMSLGAMFAVGSFFFFRIAREHYTRRLNRWKRAALLVSVLVFIVGGFLDSQREVSPDIGRCYSDRDSIVEFRRRPRTNESIGHTLSANSRYWQRNVLESHTRC